MANYLYPLFNSMYHIAIFLLFLTNVAFLLVVGKAIFDFDFKIIIIFIIWTIVLNVSGIFTIKLLSMYKEIARKGYM